MKRIVVLVICVLFICAFPGFGQTRATVIANGMLSRLRGAEWGNPYWEARRAAGFSCGPRIPAQMDIYATVEWTHHCSEAGGGIIRESFYYVFGEPARTAKLRVDMRPADESPEVTAGVLGALQAKLIERFGSPDHAPELIEIGFRRLRYGQPVAGDHWKNGSLHYFLHANQSNQSPMGMRRGVQLVVMHDRLMRERARDEFILQVEGLHGAPRPDDPVRSRLNREIGAAYTKSINFQWKTPAEREQGVSRTDRDLTALLRETDRSTGEDKALRLLAADALVSKLSGLLVESPPGGEREAAETTAVRRKLARRGIRLGHMTHYGGLEYNRDLLRRVWREFPETEAGEMAFVELQNRGWNTDSGEGCPKNPDLFREVVEKGEAFLALRPRTRFRKDVMYTLAVANESWWSISHAPGNDPIVSAPPYPRRYINARQSAAARERAIRYYREVVRSAPESPEAASALRRLPRMMLGLDTGQRRFYCSYC
ncbi:MAG: hypothetical protein M3Z85_20865 [Acidobacteriota bacterium]|nr:hypothetical protein [Acidobacteriota bacterium]